MTLKAIAYQIADGIELRAFREAFPIEVHDSDPDELFYIIDGDRYLLVFKYGVVCFLNFDEIKTAEFLTFIKPMCRNPLRERLSEELLIETDAPEFSFGYNKIDILEGNVAVFRIVMLNVSQSVALDYYSQQTTALLEETNHHTQILEKKGSLDISGRNLTRFIGRTLNLKNRISENLYIFDSPDITWEDERLNRVDMGLKKTFDLQIRFRNIRDELEIVKENLELFKDIMQHRKSLMLEWVIILLILVEVINLFVEKLL
jgi:uncharacterized Rmd1/YagE family protein